MLKDDASRAKLAAEKANYAKKMTIAQLEAGIAKLNK